MIFHVLYAFNCERRINKAWTNANFVKKRSYKIRSWKTTWPKRKKSFVQHVGKLCVMKQTWECMLIEVTMLSSAKSAVRYIQLRTSSTTCIQCINKFLMKTNKLIEMFDVCKILFFLSSSNGASGLWLTEFYVPKWNMKLLVWFCTGQVDLSESYF